MFFLLMMAVFGACMWWLIAAKQLVFRVLAACLAFVPAMMFGVAAVNKYYDYYQNWHAAVADLTSQGVTAPIRLSNTKAGPGFSDFLGHTINMAAARQQGYLLTDYIHGPASNLTRLVYVYLPPQYFQAGFYGTYRFPVIELLHGFPGNPDAWINVLGANQMLQTLMTQGRAKPAVLVMPDVNGGPRVSLQCLNQAGGPADATYLAADLPQYIYQHLRVQRPGFGWGVAGYSEGGFCAVNLGLQYGNVFNYAGVLSGYFVPAYNQLTDPSREVSPFGGNRQLALANTPTKELQSMPPGKPIPQFWLGVGERDLADTTRSTLFWQALQLRQPQATLRFVPGGGHTMLTWRALLPPMLTWMTQGLYTQILVRDDRLARYHAAAVAAALRRKIEAERKKLQVPLHGAPPHGAPPHLAPPHGTPLHGPVLPHSAVPRPKAVPRPRPK